MRTDQMTTISMRFDSDHLKRVDARAKAMGISRTELVKYGLALVMGEKVLAPPEDSSRTSLMVAEDVSRGDCIHPKERREYLRMAHRWRCLDCGATLEMEDQ